MAESSKLTSNEILLRNLAQLKKRALNVKFDLDGSDYLPQENIGIGAYGVVCSAIHKKTNDRVAIKKIPNVFDVKDVAKRTYREIKILKHFKHDNIIHIREILKPKETLKDFRDIYVVFDLMESDLHKIIYSKQELSEEHARYFLYQILRALKYIHSANVIHRDLKPSNLLVNEDCQLRIGDFGMARGVSSSPEEANYFMTQYVATRWYRAPEIMLSLIEYGAAVDMWSVGCIFAEMLGRKHLFPGKDYVSQIKLIIGVLGTPKENLLELCQSSHIKNFIKELGCKAPVPFTKLFPKASRKALHLLSGMLILHPKERLTVEQALVHPYLNKYHDADDEPICVPVFNFDFEKEDLSVDQIRENIHNEVMAYHQPRTPTLSFNAFLRPVPKTPEAQIPQPFLGAIATAQGTPLLLQPSGGTTAASQAAKTSPPKAVDQSKQDMPVFQISDEEVFKRPLSAKNSDESVRISTEDLLKAESSDIEMLSAKSTDGKPQMSAAVKEEKLKKENREPQVEDDKNKTVSQGTKALIKAALLNASLKKQRNESLGEEEKPKPVTAAQRQREREDKRKKKKEKTLERRRREKEKKAQEQTDLLTDEDKELLQRWAKMQKVNVPIAPKPEKSVRPDCALSRQQGVTITVPVGGVKSESVLNQQQCDTNQQKTIDLKPQLGTMIGQSLNLETQAGSQPAVQTSVSQQTLSGLQQRLQGNSTVTITTVHSDGDIPNQSGVAAKHLRSSDTEQGQPQTTVFPSQSPGTREQTTSQVFDVDFSTIKFDELDFIQIPSLNLPTTSQEESSVHGKYNHPPMEKSDSIESNEGSAGTGFLQKLCAGDPVQYQTSSNNIHQLSPPSFKLPDSEHLAVHHGDQVSPSQQRLSPTQLQHQISPNHHQVSPNHHQFSPELHHISPNHQQISPNHQRQDANIQGQRSPQAPHFFPSFADPPQQNLLPVHPHPLPGTSNQPVQQMQQPLYRHRDSGGFDQQNSSSNSNSNSPPTLSINARQAQMTFQQQFQNQEPVASTSHAGNQHNVLPTDLMTSLIKQLSRQNVEDACPPLALTPKGTGGGYGVGVDLDSLLMSSQEMEGHAPEPSPLSSSILADWMEVTGNMNIDMEALEQELSSPMALSYNDLNLYSS